MPDLSPVAGNIAYRQNAPSLEPLRHSSPEVEIVESLTPEEAKKRVAKWDLYDNMFKTLQDDALALYAQFEVHEDTINPMIWPTDSYAKTQIYKHNHFLWLYYEARCRALKDMLNALLALQLSEVEHRRD